MPPDSVVPDETLKWLATLGVGGVLAGIMFMFYRKDVKQFTELWKTVTDQLMGTVKENTASNIKLTALIESQERNMMRKSDILDLVDARLTAFNASVNSGNIINMRRRSTDRPAEPG